MTYNITIIWTVGGTAKYCSTTGTEASGPTISVHSAHDHDTISSSQNTLCLRYHGLLPNCSHSLIDFAVHLSMSMPFASLADVFVFAFFC